MEQENNKKNDHVLGATGQRNNDLTGDNNNKTVSRQEFQLRQKSGYKEQHDLMVVHRSNEANDGDEQEEDAHCDDPPDDVDA